MVDEINFDPITGWPSDVLDDILAGVAEKFTPGFWKLLGFIWNQNLPLDYKAGMTVNPEKRAQRYGDDYDYMDVVYKTQSYDHAVAVERGIIDEYIDDKYNQNLIAGGGGKLPNDGGNTHYVYIVYNI